MRLIKLDATRSTNATLKELWQNNHTVDWTVVWAVDQTQGRGQQGSQWISEPGKNLTFSVLKEFEALEARYQFLLNMAVSLAVHETLLELDIADVRVKWPNDIMSGSEKICGILIENIVKSNNIQAAIIGIGLNVNQVDYGDIRNAGSLKTVSGKEYNIDAIYSLLTKSLKRRLEMLNSTSLIQIRPDYLKVLYRLDQESDFQVIGKAPEKGIIRGISEEGKLRVELNGVISEFANKQIQLIE